MFGSSLPPQKMRVLCAEDHELMGKAIKRLLEHAGHDVVWVKDGQAAWERVVVDSCPFDVVITDQKMPRLTGLGLVRKLRRAAFGGGIIVHSAHVPASAARTFRNLGVNHILAKPADISVLLHLIKAHGRAK